MITWLAADPGLEAAAATSAGPLARPKASRLFPTGGGALAPRARRGPMSDTVRLALSTAASRVPCHLAR
eukprot:748432-Hanusia_phi.AAC.1